MAGAGVTRMGLSLKVACLQAMLTNQNLERPDVKYLVPKRLGQIEVIRM